MAALCGKLLVFSPVQSADLPPLLSKKVPHDYEVYCPLAAGCPLSRRCRRGWMKETALKYSNVPFIVIQINFNRMSVRVVLTLCVQIFELILMLCGRLSRILVLIFSLIVDRAFAKPNTTETHTSTTTVQRRVTSLKIRC